MVRLFSQLHLISTRDAGKYKICVTIALKTAVIRTIGATARKNAVTVPVGIAMIEASITTPATAINENPLAQVATKVVMAGARTIFFSIAR